MKKIQQLCAAVVLTMALVLSASAGDMSAPGATNPTPQQESSVTGDMAGPGVTSLDPVTEAALSLLQSLLSLF